MKLRFPYFSQCTAIACAAVLATPSNAAVQRPVAKDPAAEALARRGHVAVQAAGDYVERGTMRIQVLVKLGKPDLVTADGAWVYRRKAVTGSAAQGSLVVKFADGRVSELALASPAVVAAWRKDSEERERGRARGLDAAE